MKYVYLYSWFLLSWCMNLANSIVFPVASFIGRRSRFDAQRWKEQFVAGLLEFPGGIIDWGAFGLLLVFEFLLFGVLIVIFSVASFFFEPPWIYIASLILIAGVSYYRIYVVSVPWLDKRINGQKT